MLCTALFAPCVFDAEEAEEYSRYITHTHTYRIYSSKRGSEKEVCSNCTNVASQNLCMEMNVIYINSTALFMWSVVEVP